MPRQRVKQAAAEERSTPWHDAEIAIQPGWLPASRGGPAGMTPHQGHQPTSDMGWRGRTGQPPGNTTRAGEAGTLGVTVVAVAE